MGNEARKGQQHYLSADEVVLIAAYRRTPMDFRVYIRWYAETCAEMFKHNRCVVAFLRAM